MGPWFSTAVVFFASHFGLLMEAVPAHRVVLSWSVHGILPRTFWTMRRLVVLLTGTTGNSYGARASQQRQDFLQQEVRQLAATIKVAETRRGQHGSLLSTIKKLGSNMQPKQMYNLSNSSSNCNCWCHCSDTVECGFGTPQYFFEGVCECDGDAQIHLPPILPPSSSSHHKTIPFTTYSPLRHTLLCTQAGGSFGHQSKASPNNVFHNIVRRTFSRSGG